MKGLYDPAESAFHRQRKYLITLKITMILHASTELLQSNANVNFESKHHSYLCSVYLLARETFDFVD